MRKYGIEHFHVELLEETDNPEERERYWIERLGSFKAGYNATLGGDGKRYVDYDLVATLYMSGLNEKEVAKKLKICDTTVRVALLSKNIQIRSTKHGCKPVQCISKDTGNEIIRFESCGDGARWLIQEGISHATVGSTTNKITEVANGKRHSAYGFYWRFL
ncbi:MAG: hypothetical protein NC218_09530 [Acetobacter sp.]|nr:hypothetical protein [Acetobacter sp.]